ETPRSIRNGTLSAGSRKEIPMRGGQGWGTVLGFLVLASAMPARADGQLAPGTELIYGGTLEKKEVQTDVPEVTYRARERRSVLVARADPDQGYTILFMRDIRPELPLGPAKPPPYAEAVILRYRP